MDHGSFDARSVADRYLDHTLPPEERSAFEAHLVDCQECTDRLLLAEMFRQLNGNRRNGASHAGVPSRPVSAPAAPKIEAEALRVRFVRQFTPLQLTVILAGAAALLILVTFSLLSWVVPR